MQYWPVIERVVLKCKQWGVLAGLQLIDAPGLHDVNIARNKVNRSIEFH